MTRKKVLIFIESFSGGGAERVLLTILRNLDMSRYDVTVLVMSDSGVYKDDFHCLGINIVPVLRSNFSILNKIKYKLLYNILSPAVAARWLFKGLKADIYIAFVEGYCTKILSCLHVNRRKIAWVHTDLKNHPWTIKKGIYKCSHDEIEAYKKYDLIIGVSNDVSAVLMNYYGLNNVLTIYNPIDEKRISLLSREQNNIKIDNSYFNLVSVGRLTQPKGYDHLIGQMSKILHKNPQVKLYLIGEGEERENLEFKINELGLNNKVVLTGFMKNPYSLMKDMDLFVCSSVAEGFSLVIAEAMIVGLPIISTECSGPSELLGHGQYGILCSDYDKMGAEIVRISNDKNSLQELREKTKVRALDFNTKNIISQIEQIL